jgi:hypothetical protein
MKLSSKTHFFCGVALLLLALFAAALIGAANSFAYDDGGKKLKIVFVTSASPGNPVSCYEDLDKDYILYVMKCEQYLKVGITGDLARRLRGIETHNPFYTSVVMHMPIKYAVSRWVEARIHDALKKFHDRGEWFIADLKTISPIVKMWCRRGEKRIMEWRMHVRRHVPTWAESWGLRNREQ